MEIGGFALRDIVVVVLALAGVYLVVMLLHLARMRKRKSAAAGLSPLHKAPAATATAGDEEDEDEEVFVYARPAAPAPVRPVPAPADNVHDFSAELSRSHLEREVKQLRDEIAALRTELVELKAAQRVSPQYADAVALVQRGLTAQDVADRCGISLAEADLVSALARGPQFDEEDDHGSDAGRTHARTA